MPEPEAKGGQHEQIELADLHRGSCRDVSQHIIEVMNISRRAVLGSAAFAAAAAQTPANDRLTEIFKKHDAGVQRMLAIQNTDTSSRFRGGFPDEYGMYPTGSASGFLAIGIAAALSPQSRFHHDAELIQRMRLAADFVSRTLTPDGNVNLYITNFNSTPDTGFVVHGLASATVVAQRRKEQELLAISVPILKRMGASLAHGGIHTPNHRWVVSAALAQLYEIFREPSYLKRIDQWLAEGIDIDEDGQFDERSTTVYNTVCDHAFTTMAAKLNRPELLEPVRRNLNSMLYLVHPNGDVVTEISRRQDLNTRGNMGRYWFPLQYLAIHDGNGQFGQMAENLFGSHASALPLLEYPELLQHPKTEPLPDNYLKELKTSGCVRIRRGAWSATILSGRDRFFTIRNGDAIVNAVRFASAFFGKGQFAGGPMLRDGSSWRMTQNLEGPYYQPLDPPQKVAAGQWGAFRSQRKQTQICKLEQSATITELPNGFRLRMQSDGTPDVPVSVEINVREDVQISGIDKDSILASGQAELRAGSSTLRIGPGHREHSYTQIRGALPKLPGSTVYLTGLTPFDQTIEFKG